MSYDEIIQLISGVAFPIAMCILMGIYISKLQEQYNAQLTKLDDSLDNVKLVLEQLKTILERRGQ